uniref:Uncharacterized protein n=1 Tax=Rhizophora mucronata TaxID=61149 RepID=A0A2P2N0W9_RHIMU
MPQSGYSNKHLGSNAGQISLQYITHCLGSHQFLYTKILQASMRLIILSAILLISLNLSKSSLLLFTTLRILSITFHCCKMLRILKSYTALI